METTTYLYILIAVIVSLAIAAFHYFYKAKSRSKTNGLLAFLRFLSIFSLLLLLINPKIESLNIETIKPKLVVAVDNSSSIEYLEQDEILTSRIIDIKQNNALKNKFDVSYFSFSEKINNSDSLNFRSNKTNIIQTLSELSSLFKEDNSILLFTDGNQTIGSDYSYFKSKNKIYPIAIGDTIASEDLRISNLNVNRYSFLKNTFPVELFVNYIGNNTVSTNLIVYKGKNPVFRKAFNLSEENNSEKILFNLTANSVGTHNYKVIISKTPLEKNVVNNQKSFSVEVIDEQAKVAIISDIMHPDLGVLKRSIETNKQRKAEILKPNADIKFNDYQLFIIYQPNNNFKEIFEKNENDNSNYFIISGTNTDWSFLNGAQTHFSKATINQPEEYFPVKNTSYSAFLVEDFNFDNLPPLEVKFGDLTFKTPYEVLLYQSINGIQTEKPLLATFSKDEKKGALLLGEGIWKWRSFLYSDTKSFLDFDSFINKLIQFLSSKKLNSRLDLSYEPIVYQNDIITIKATYFDSNYEPDSRANVTLTIKNNETNSIKEYPFRLGQGEYITSISDLEPGEYSFTVSVKDQNITKNGSFTVLDYNIEQQFSYANINALKSLATNSNGKLYHISNSDILIDNLIKDETIKPTQKSTTKQMSLIDWEWLLGVIILSLSLEWFIRKYYGKI